MGLQSASVLSFEFHECVAVFLVPIAVLDSFVWKFSRAPQALHIPIARSEVDSRECASIQLRFPPDIK